MKRFLSLCFCMILSLGALLPPCAAKSDPIADAVSDVATIVYETAASPQVGSIGGEWAVLGLARSGVSISSAYFDSYIRSVEDTLRACGGVLHKKKYTEYSRVILALTAIGKDPANVAGYNLLIPLGDYEQTILQGVNGAIWALIALDSANYAIPENSAAKTQATREKYLDFILQKQLENGGFAFAGARADADLTAMAIQALAKYTDKPAVRSAVSKALSCLSEMQEKSGGFASGGAESAESCAQVIVALCELGISPSDARFVKSGRSALDNLLTFYVKGRGFKHLQSDKTAQQMPTEQGLYALAAVMRLQNGQNSLYRMTDTESREGGGLVGKHPDVQKLPIAAKKGFTDAKGHKSQTAIEALASRNIINGRDSNHFDPDAGMTRAEFAAILAKGLGLPQKGGAAFDDVKESDWFFKAVNTACAYGIVKGVSPAEFSPNGSVTREEAAVMIARAAALCGLSTDYTAFEARNVLAVYPDYVKASDWAYTSLAFCYDRGITDDSAAKILPKEAVTRAEIAQMLYNLLALSKLL